MIFVFIFLAGVGSILALAGFVVSVDDEISAKDRHKGSAIFLAGCVMMMLAAGGLFSECSRMGNGCSVSKELNEVTGQPRNPFPFNN